MSEDRKRYLNRARDLLEGMDERHQLRLDHGNLGAWQTEVNEIRRILHYLLDEPQPPPRPPRDFSVDDDLTDTHLDPR